MPGQWGGEFVNVVDAARGSLTRFAELSATFRAFDDPVRKLTMVNAIMLAGSGLTHFDEEPLPGIDYHLIKQAVRQGLVIPRAYTGQAQGRAVPDPDRVAGVAAGDADGTPAGRRGIGNLDRGDRQHLLG